MNKKKIVVIGGGFSGLATASLLAKQGFAVALLEKNGSLGGRARVLEKKGFKFDMGPSWYMMPEIFDRFFAHFGKKPADYYQLQRLDPSYKVFFEKSKPITISADILTVRNIFERIEKGAGATFIRYLGASKKYYYLATTELIYQELLHLPSWMSFSKIATLVQLVFQRNMLRSWSSQVKSLFKDDRIFKILTFPSVFLGGSPYITPAIFSILSWADFGKGIWYPLGGMTQVVKAMARIAKEEGVSINLNADVTDVGLKDNRITTVIAGGKKYVADYVVVAADLPYFEMKVLPPQFQSYSGKYWENKTLGVSSLMLYLGINKKLQNAVHHTLYFSDDWEKNFKEIFTLQMLPKNPSLYVSIRSVTDSSIVPKGCEEIVVLIPVPATTAIAKSEYLQLAEKVITRLEDLFKEKIRDSVVVKELFTPQDFANDYHAYQGTALGLAHTLTQSFIFRPANRSKKVRNLFYTGQYTNPGIGVPMALISAEVVSTAVTEYDKLNNI